jgi:hypothetical protein
VQVSETARSGLIIRRSLVRDIVRIFHDGVPIKAHPRHRPNEEEEVVWSHHRR